ncbi:MAG: DUF4340 domain-containing protein [Desulfarculus sp.]|nr:DUF4340 domain-containing protein [Desulfarculus sp.]
MKARQLIVWVLALAAVAAAWFITESLERDSAREKDQAGRVVSLSDPQAVAVLELGGEAFPQPVRIERRDQEHRWQITSPLQAPADSLAVGRVLGGLIDARIKERLAKPEDPAQFGLAKPWQTLALTDRGGQRTELLVGDLSPSRDLLYLAPPDRAAVWLVPAEVRGSLAKDLFDLRDKTVLDFVVSAVERLEMRLGGKNLALTRQRGGSDPLWTLEGQGPADPRAVEDLLFQIHGLQALAFIDQGFDLAKLGLEKPGEGLWLTLEKGQKLGLAIGGQVPNQDRRHLRRWEGGPVMEVAADSLKRLERQPLDLVERHVLKLDRARASGLTLRREGRELVYAKGGEGWKRVQPAPAGEPKPDEQERPDFLLWDLASLKWEKILPPGEYGLKPARIVIEVALGAEADRPAANLTLMIGELDPESGLLAVATPGDGRIFGVKPELLKRVDSLVGPAQNK